jgi:hypothetical protein
MARNKLATYSFDTEAQFVAVKFSDGVEQKFDISAVDPAIMLHLAMHGLKQKSADSYAGATEAVVEGLAKDTLTYAKEQVRRVWEMLTQGEWSSRGESGPRVSMLAKAIAEALSIEIDDALERLEAMEEADLKKVKANSSIQKILTRMKREALEKREAELAAKASDSEDLANLMK